MIRHLRAGLVRHRSQLPPTFRDLSQSLSTLGFLFFLASTSWVGPRRLAYCLVDGKFVSCYPNITRCYTFLRYQASLLGDAAPNGGPMDKEDSVLGGSRIAFNMQPTVPDHRVNAGTFLRTRMKSSLIGPEPVRTLYSD
ncbi:hypothetical protein BDV12DRAFT_54826 [Aspergillus spectabilis]